MKRITILITIIVILFSSTCYNAESQLKTAQPNDIPCRIGLTAQQVFEAMQGIAPMTVEEFCACLPCLCCDCGGRKTLKQGQNPCSVSCLPDVERRKLCCEGMGEPWERIVTWSCCEPVEPPCKCCPCDLEDCPPPNELGKFYVTFSPSSVPDLGVYLIMLSEIVQAHGGKTCCEEDIMQNGHSSGCTSSGQTGWVNVCVDPTIAPIIEEAARQAGIPASYSPGLNMPTGKPCWCLGK